MNAILSILSAFFFLLLSKATVIIRTLFGRKKSRNRLSYFYNTEEPEAK